MCIASGPETILDNLMRGFLFPATELGDALKRAAVAETPDVGIFIDLAEELRQTAKQSPATVLLVVDQICQTVVGGKIHLRTDSLFSFELALFLDRDQG